MCGKSGRLTNVSRLCPSSQPHYIQTGCLPQFALNFLHHAGSVHFELSHGIIFTSLPAKRPPHFCLFLAKVNLLLFLRGLLTIITDGEVENEAQLRMRKFSYFAN